MTGRIEILAQYVKDLSFENPHAPDSLQHIRRRGKPELKLDIHIEVHPVREDLFESVLNLAIGSSQENKTNYLIELSYAALISIKEIESEQADWTLRVEIPQLLFPFVRNMIAELTRDGGYPPLLLGPIDFATAYKSRGQPRDTSAPAS